MIQGSKESQARRDAQAAITSLSGHQWARPPELSRAQAFASGVGLDSPDQLRIPLLFSDVVRPGGPAGSPTLVHGGNDVCLPGLP